MVNLNKGNKKGRSGASMKFLCTVIVTVAALAGVAAISLLVKHIDLVLICLIVQRGA